jgi:hypothetical protein
MSDELAELLASGSPLAAAVDAARHGVALPDLAGTVRELAAVNDELDALIERHEWAPPTYHQLRGRADVAPLRGEL